MRLEDRRPRTGGIMSRSVTMHSRIGSVAMACLIVFSPMTRAEPSPAARESAATLLRAMGLERTMMAGVAAMVDVQIRQNATLVPFRDVLLSWAERFLTWDAVAPQLIDLYAERFTEAELQDLIAFYQSPTGRKSLVELPVLTRQGAALGAELAKKHAPELERMIRERAEELRKAMPAATPARP